MSFGISIENKNLSIQNFYKCVLTYHQLEKKRSSKSTRKNFYEIIEKMILPINGGSKSKKKLSFSSVNSGFIYSLLIEQIKYLEFKSEHYFNQLHISLKDSEKIEKKIENYKILSGNTNIDSQEMEKQFPQYSNIQEAKENNYSLCSTLMANTFQKIGFFNIGFSTYQSGYKDPATWIIPHIDELMEYLPAKNGIDEILIPLVYDNTSIISEEKIVKFVQLKDIYFLYEDLVLIMLDVPNDQKFMDRNRNNITLQNFHYLRKKKLL